MFAVAAAALIAAMALAIVRAVAGPTLYDRVLAGNSFGTKTVLLIGVMGYVTGRPDFLDIALLYALINFASTIAILKFFRYRTLSVTMEGDEVDKPEFETGPGLSEPGPSKPGLAETGLTDPDVKGNAPR